MPSVIWSIWMIYPSSYGHTSSNSSIYWINAMDRASPSRAKWPIISRSPSYGCCNFTRLTRWSSCSSLILEKVSMTTPSSWIRRMRVDLLTPIISAILSHENFNDQWNSTSSIFISTFGRPTLQKEMIDSCFKHDSLLDSTHLPSAIILIMRVEGREEQSDKLIIIALMKILNKMMILCKIPWLYVKYC